MDYDLNINLNCGMPCPDKSAEGLSIYGAMLYTCLECLYGMPIADGIAHLEDSAPQYQSL